MFGYVKPYRSELKVREFDLYKAYYCGLCRSIKKKHGQLGTVTLSYDSTFLAIMLNSLNEEKEIIQQQRCFMHPVKKRLFVKSNDSLEYASDINIILAYYNLKDNWVDDKDIKSLFIKLLLHKAFKKIYKKYTDKCDIIDKNLNLLSQLEKSRCKYVDEAAEPFAKVVEEVFNYEFIEDDKIIKQLKWIGYNTGKWIYMVDALDDIQNDIKSNNYNPFVEQFELNNTNEIKNFLLKENEHILFMLEYPLSEAANAYKQLISYKNENLVMNIFYLGMRRIAENIIKRSCN